MYIETVLKRLNAFRADNKERYSFPYTYQSEPYSGYKFSDILALAMLYPHEVSTGESGEDTVEVPGLSIRIVPWRRTVVETCGEYTLVTGFPLDSAIPVFILRDGNGKAVYTRMASSLEFEPLTNKVVGGHVTERWLPDDRDDFYPGLIRQDYHLTEDGDFAGTVKLTYETKQYSIVEKGYVTREYGKYFKYATREFIISGRRGNKLSEIINPGSDERKTFLYDRNDVARKAYISNWTTTDTYLYDSKDKELHPGIFERITHRYELESGKVEAALMSSGADRFDDKYLDVHTRFRIDSIPEFPVPAKENKDEKAEQ